jgi:hypothetical protein
MQQRSELTREVRRNSIIDEESEEEKPADIRVTEKARGVRDQSLSSCDDTHGDSSPMRGFDQPVKSNNTSYLERQGMFGEDEPRSKANTGSVKPKSSSSKPSQPSSIKPPQARSHAVKKHTRHMSGDSADINDGSVERESDRHQLMDRSVSHPSEAASFTSYK